MGGCHVMHLQKVFYKFDGLKVPLPLHPSKVPLPLHPSKVPLPLHPLKCLCKVTSSIHSGRPHTCMTSCLPTHYFSHIPLLPHPHPPTFLPSHISTPPNSPLHPHLPSSHIPTPPTSPPLPHPHYSHISTPPTSPPLPHLHPSHISTPPTSPPLHLALHRS